jgi:uncharacterized protein (DUF1810 family)
MANDLYDLQRFVEAQEPVIERAMEELRSGEKRSHWMWFVFPQMKGLGRSPMAERFGIGSREEAAAYLGHAVLGERLRECTRLANAVEGRSVEQIFGFPDDLKFRSSMTLFAEVESGGGVFREALGKYFDGKVDRETVRRLG